LFASIITVFVLKLSVCVSACSVWMKDDWWVYEREKIIQILCCWWKGLVSSW